MPRAKSSNSIDKHVGSRIRMRRTMLDMSLANSATPWGLHFSKFRNTRRARARLVRADIAQILQVPVAFFFEDDMPAGGDSKHMIASPNTVMDFMSTSEGLALAKAFMKIRSMPVRRRIVELVEGIGG